MALPTWEAVGISECFLNSIRKLPVSPLIDSLIQQVVMHHPKRVNARYVCAACGYVYVPERATEQINACPNCTSQKLSLSQHWRNPDAGAYTRLPNRNPEILFAAMNNNYKSYLGQPVEKIFDWGYVRGKFWVEFLSGEKAYADTPMFAAFRASLLVPFLWDPNFQWEAGQLGDGFICHVLNQWLEKRR